MLTSSGWAAPWAECSLPGSGSRVSARLTHSPAPAARSPVPSILCWDGRHKPSGTSRSSQLSYCPSCIAGLSSLGSAQECPAAAPAPASLPRSASPPCQVPCAPPPMLPLRAGTRGLDGPPAQGSPSQGQVASLWAKTWLSQAVTTAGPESCCLVPEPHAKVSRAMTLRRTLERPSGLCKPPLGAGFQPGPHVRIPQLGRRWLEKVETQAPRWTHERHLQGTSPASAMF